MSGIHSRLGGRSAVLRQACLTLILTLALALSIDVKAAALLEEGFNYAAGTSLAANPPWAGGTSAGVTIISSNLGLTALRGTSPAGNALQITGGASANVYRNFSGSPVTSGTLYCSMLINCTQLPTNSQVVGGLLSAGSTSLNAPDDPVDLYINGATNGFTFSIGHTGADPARTRTMLSPNTIHFIVLKYVFGAGGQATIFVDPIPGNAEPASGAASTEYGEGNDPANIQEMLLRPLRSGTPGKIVLDTIRVGTNWADVTPLPNALSIQGPADVAVCGGSSAVFQTSVSGTAPFAYQWRTNGMPVPNATNAALMVNNAGPADALNTYDVIVNDAFGSATSRVARLSISTHPAQIVADPTNQVVWPSVSNVTFTVNALGDPPLSYQWFTNSVAIPGATNSSYTVTNPSPADELNAFTVTVSNPCGVAVSSVPARIVFPTAFSIQDALPGFFGGMNLFVTNTSGLAMYAWSSPDPGQPVTSWALEGMMDEQPLNDGTGNSRYSINVNPVTSPVYYLAGESTSAPYLQPVPVSWIITDEVGNYYFFTNEVSISASGVLEFPGPPFITQGPTAQLVPRGTTATFSVVAGGVGPISYQWYFNQTTLLPNATNAVLNVTNVSGGNAGLYEVVVSNAYGSTNSIPVALTLSQPILTVLPVGPGIHISSVAATNTKFFVQATANLIPPIIWTTIATNITDGNGIAQFTDTNSLSMPGRFYRIQFQ